MSMSDLSCSTAPRLKTIPPYDFSLTVHKPAGWSLLTLFGIFEGGILWTVMRTPSRRIFGLKLRTVETVKKPEVDCEAENRLDMPVSESQHIKLSVELELGVRGENEISVVLK